MEREAGLFCLEMWHSPHRGRLLLLAGNNGTGKTHCAKAINLWVKTVGPSKEWVVKADGERRRAYLDVIYWHWPRLLDRFKEGQWDLVDDMIDIPCLILDELGGGHDPSKVGTDKLCTLLSHREKKWTVITTNILPSEWESVFDRRITSRFFRNSTLIDLSDVPDFNV